VSAAKGPMLNSLVGHLHHRILVIQVLSVGVAWHDQHKGVPDLATKRDCYAIDGEQVASCCFIDRIGGRQQRQKISVTRLWDELAEWVIPGTSLPKRLTCANTVPLMLAQIHWSRCTGRLNEQNQEWRAITHELQVKCITKASSMLASNPFSAAHARVRLLNSSALIQAWHKSCFDHIGTSACI